MRFPDFFDFSGAFPSDSVRAASLIRFFAAAIFLISSPLILYALLPESAPPPPPFPRPHHLRPYFALTPAAHPESSLTRKALLRPLENDAAFRPAPATAFLTACVMVKDAVDAIPEFVARNHLAGVDHFVLMDDSTPSSFEHLHHVIAPLGPLVSLLRVARNDEDYARARGWSAASQIDAVLECAESLRGRTRWVAFIDVDEFFEANDGWWDGVYRLDKTPGRRFVADFLTAFENRTDHPAVCVKWKSVLTNGRVEPAPCGRLLSEHYSRTCNVSGKDGHPLGRRKAVVKLEHLSTEGTPRDDSYGHTGFQFEAPFRRFQCSDDLAPVEISIVHYWSMSLIDYLRKIARGRPRRSLEQRTMFDLLLREQMCDKVVPDWSSASRAGAVRKLLVDFGFKCRVVAETNVQWSKGDEERLERIVAKEGPALKFLLDQHNKGLHFNSSKYAAGFKLEYKQRFGGFLSVIDLIPWVHYVLHGYDPGTASLWFSESRIAPKGLLA